MSKPLAIDLFSGLGGWAEGLLAEGYDVIGFDIERHVYLEHRYPAQLVIQDVLTLRGSQFRGAALIVASPPCQAYSYRAMPWTRAKALPPPCNALFEACFRIQREACEAAGRHIPMIVENVRGAQPWVGRARWNHGSFYLWGDVPALMPIGGAYKTRGMNWSDRERTGQDFTRIGGNQAIHIRHGATHTKHVTNPAEHGVKLPGGGKDGWFGRNNAHSLRQHSSGSTSRKFASAMIAKIPEALSRHIGRTFYPRADLS
jgi:C-5 cytosine-specific DNA methylase